MKLAPFVKKEFPVPPLLRRRIGPSFIIPVTGLGNVTIRNSNVEYLGLADWIATIQEFGTSNVLLSTDERMVRQAHHFCHLTKCMITFRVVIVSVAEGCTYR